MQFLFVNLIDKRSFIKFNNNDVWLSKKAHERYLNQTFQYCIFHDMFELVSIQIWNRLMILFNADVNLDSINLILNKKVLIANIFVRIKIPF